MRSLYLLVLSVFWLGMDAQECLPTELVLSTSIENNGTLFMEWSLNEAGGATVSSGGNQFSVESTSVPFSACLLPGCYQLVAEADGMIPPISTWLSVQVTNGFVNEYDYTVEGNSYTVNFCVTENSECVLQVEVAETEDCNVIALTAVEFNPNAQLFWTVNGDPVDASVALIYEATEAGTYEICVAYETPDCPQGEFWCESFEVTPGCLEGVDCGMTLTVNEVDCGNFNVVATVPSGWQNVSWTLNDEPLEGLVWTQEFDLPDGEYVICASFESPACGFVSECTTVVVNCAPSPCDLTVSVVQLDCSPVLLTASNFPEGAQIEWFVDGDFVESGTAFDFSPETAGSYQICAQYETPDCPQGVSWCETFTWGPGCFGECPYELFVDQNDCIGVFILDGGIQGPVSFFVDGVLVNNGENAFTYLFPENGTYTVCAVYEGVCDQTEFCQTIEVTNCGEPDPCELEVAIMQLDCSPVLLTASNFPEGAQIEWFVDGDFVESGTAFDFSPETAGSYQICAQYETPDCPQGVSWCETFTWGPGCFGECPYELFVDQNDCIGVFILDGGIQGPVSFFVDGVLVNNGENAFTYLFPENGTYTVCAVYEGVCDQTEFCQTIEVTNCGEPDPCTLEYTLTQTGCGEYTAEVTQAPEGLDVYLFWLGDVILMENGSATFNVDVTEVYEVCLFIESDECPEGVFECIEQELFGCECPDEISAGVEGCVGEFDLSGVLAGPGAQFFVNGVFVGDDTNWGFTYEFPTNGNYEVCAISNNPACENFALCTEVEITDCVTCTEVIIEVTANPSAIEEALLLQALIEGIALDADIEVLFFELEASLGIGVCLPDGCYELNAELPGIPSLDIAVTVGDEVVLEHSFSAANPSVSLEFGINDDCGEGVGEFAAQSILAYPVPAAQTVTLEWPFAGLTALVVYDMTGRVVATQQATVNGRLVLDVSGLANGVYLVQAAGEFGLYSGRIQVSR